MANKFHAKKTTIDGITFDSKIESEYYLYLKSLKEQGLVQGFEMQSTFILQEKFIKFNNQIILGSDNDFNKLKRKYKLKTTPAITYKADFDVLYKDGTRQVVDIKGGVLTDTFKIKEKMFNYKFPELTLSVITKDKSTGKWVSFEENKKIKAERKKARKNKTK